MDCVPHLRLTVVCGPPDNSEGKVILYIDKMCELGGWGGREMQDAAEDSHLS